MTVLTVVIPAFNAGRHLRSAVDSVLAQGLPGVEILVVDDGSTDGSAAAAAGPGVSVLRQANRGEAAARNAGVRAAAAPFLTFLDADDLLSPGALEPRLSHLRAHPSELAVGGLPSRLIGEDGAPLAEVFERMKSGLSFPFRLDRALYRDGGFFPVSCSLYLYRREAFDRVGFYDEALPAAPDCDFHFRLLAEGEIPVLPVRVFDRRMHARNLSLTGADRPAFRPEILDAVKAINRRHGFAPKEIAPWELAYL